MIWWKLSEMQHTISSHNITSAQLCFWLLSTIWISLSHLKLVEHQTAQGVLIKTLSKMNSFRIFNRFLDIYKMGEEARFKLNFTRKYNNILLWFPSRLILFSFSSFASWFFLLFLVFIPADWKNKQNFAFSVELAISHTDRFFLNLR